MVLGITDLMLDFETSQVEVSTNLVNLPAEKRGSSLRKDWALSRILLPTNPELDEV